MYHDPDLADFLLDLEGHDHRDWFALFGWFTHLALSLLFGLADSGTSLGQFLPSSANLFFLSVTIFLWNSWAVSSALDGNLSSDCSASLTSWSALLFVHYGADGLDRGDTLENRVHIGAVFHSAFVSVRIGHLGTFFRFDQSTFLQVFQTMHPRADFVLQSK